MLNKAMSFIRRLNRGNFYLLSRRFQIWWLNNSMEDIIKYTISAQYLPKYVC